MNRKEVNDQDYSVVSFIYLVAFINPFALPINNLTVLNKTLNEMHFFINAIFQYVPDKGGTLQMWIG